MVEKQNNYSTIKLNVNVSKNEKLLILSKLYIISIQISFKNTKVY